MKDSNIFIKFDHSKKKEKNLSTSIFPTILMIQSYTPQDKGEGEWLEVVFRA